MNLRFPLIAMFAALAAGLAGCGAPEAKFLRYEVFAKKVEKDAQVAFSADQRRNVDEVLAAMFGTPDDPKIPVLEGIETGTVLDPIKLHLAAGPVGSDEQGNVRGLYREHCAHCHGVSGDGAGPTAAFLNPYPRDYRKGWFKFKSTPVGQKPTHDDLKKIVLEGIPGTAMPSFKLLPDLEVEALVDYVRYLSIRGEVERNLLRAMADLEENQPLMTVVSGGATAEQTARQQEEKAMVLDVVSQVVSKWVEAPASAVEIPERPRMSPEELVESRKKGRELFYGTVANCVKCHGESALGDGQTTDYDEWTKEFIADGKDRALVREYVSLGLPEPRNIKPRNLRQGVYRGGMRPIDIYWRIKNGIEGTPMPAATMKPEGDPNAKGLTTDDIWHIVNYIESLPYESISDPVQAADEAINPRERL